MKKLTFTITVALLLTLCACTRVAINGSEVTARFINEENSVEVTLTAEDAEALNGLFNDKALYNETPPCGFTKDFAFTLDGKTFCIADDGCPFVYLYESKAYFLLSNEECGTLKTLLEKYGVVYYVSEESEQSE